MHPVNYKPELDEREDVLSWMQRQLRLVMTTLSSEKQLFEGQFRYKLRECEAEVVRRDHQINQLRNQLEITEEKLRRAERQCKDYLNIIHILQKQVNSIHLIVSQNNSTNIFLSQSLQKQNTKANFKNARLYPSYSSEKRFVSKGRMKLNINPHIEPLEHNRRKTLANADNNYQQAAPSLTSRDNQTKFEKCSQPQNQYLKDITNHWKTNNEKQTKQTTGMKPPTQPQILGYIRKRICQQSKHRKAK